MVADVPDMTGALRAIRREFGIDLLSLPLETDEDYVAGVRERVRELPQRPIRLLLLSNSEKKFHEKAFLLFFNAAGTGARDCVQFDDDDRSWTKESRDPGVGPRLSNINYLSLDSALAKVSAGASYDYVVSFDCNEVLARVSDAVGAPAVHIGTPRWNVEHTPKWRRLLQALRPPASPRGDAIRVFSAMGGNLSSTDFRRALGNRLVQVRDSINFPPNVDVHFRTPSTPAFPYVVIGGGNRDFRLLHRCRHAFDGKVLVLRDAGKESLLQRHAMEKIRRDAKFVCIPYVDAAIYLRILLYSRVVVLPLLHGIRRDYTVIPDALWCGRPVVTTSIRANAHLADRLNYFRNAADLKHWVDVFAEPEQYQLECRRVRTAALREHDFQGLLANAYRYMAACVSARAQGLSQTTKGKEMIVSSSKAAPSSAS